MRTSVAFFLSAWIALASASVDREQIAADLHALERDAAALGLTGDADTAGNAALGVAADVSVRGGDDACRALSGTCINGYPNAPCNGRWESGKCSGGNSNKCCIPNNGGGNNNSGNGNNNAGGDTGNNNADDQGNNNDNNNNNNDNNNNGNGNSGSGSSHGALYVPGTNGGSSTWTGVSNPNSSKCGQKLRGNCQSKGSSCQGEFRAGYCPGSSICCAPLEKNLPNRRNDHPTVARAGSHPIMQTSNVGGSLFFKGNMDADADGGPNAYCPDNRGLDSIKNGGMKSVGSCPGSNSCYGMAFHPNSRNLCIQGPKDPFPGCYVSVTAVARSWAKRSEVLCNPNNYANSFTNPYFVIPGKSSSGMSKLDLGLIYDSGSNRALFSWVGDVGPKAHTGEASIASLLAFDWSPFMNGKIRCGTEGSSRYTYIVFAGTRADSGFIDNFEEVKRRGEIAFNNWGGMAQLEKLTGRTGIKFIGQIRSIDSVPAEYKSNGCRFMN
eukprot:TRINITY_DN207_c0_g1_i11.p1 TRINITY_DN207_c0_g1~~TRINITY_DN207_c0_g1_i11.p1  ORF type:complete len:496 (-),score=248.65 TRINITY_DN207_c0_g1_i11:115-1602(-)